MPDKNNAQDKIIRKIKSCLKLAGSDNANEAATLNRGMNGGIDGPGLEHKR